MEALTPPNQLIIYSSLQKTFSHLDISMLPSPLLISFGGERVVMLGDQKMELKGK
jgi:hypothetical protein